MRASLGLFERLIIVLVDSLQPQEQSFLSRHGPEVIPDDLLFTWSCGLTKDANGG